MYLPSFFKENDPATLYALMRENPFATLITVADGAPFVGHLPLLVRDGEILGHMARANPQWRQFPEVTAIFHGPHTYVSPTWYTSEGQVPTWNYAVVHARGRAELV